MKTKAQNLKVKPSILNELDEVVNDRTVTTQYRVRFYSDTGCKDEGIPVTEIWVDAAQATCRIRNYGLTTLECLDTISRAAAYIREKNLTIVGF